MQLAILINHDIASVSTLDFSNVFGPHLQAMPDPGFMNCIVIGADRPDTRIPLDDDRQEHTVEIELGGG